MAHNAVASAPVNGYTLATGDQDAEAAFYEQLLQLRDAVLSDTHPRFKLPIFLKEKLQSTNVTTPSASDAFPQLPGLANGVATSAQPGNVPASHDNNTDTVNGARNASAFAQNRGLVPSGGVLPNLKPQTSSGIDPIFLTKSDDLIRAETQLQRQRIERHLQDMVNQRMHGQRNKDDEQSAYLMDVSETLQKAHELVKPISGLHPPANTQNAASDSFDENSYYSSQVNDWSSESAHSREAEAAAADPQATNTVVHAVTRTQKTNDLASSASLSRGFSSKIEHLDKQALPSSQYDEPATYEQDTNFYATETDGVYDAEREDSEEYSPPAAEGFSGADADGDAMDLDDGELAYSRSFSISLNPFLDSSEFVPEEPDVPSQQAPVVTNRLTHIAAPQPARVSPLAVSKLPGLGQTQLQAPSTDRYGRPASSMTHPPPIAQVQPGQTSEEDSTSPRQSAQTSPAGQIRKSKRTNKKKRKREAEAATKARKHREKRMAVSPEPYIKPEPVSPPPMSGLSELQPARSRPHYQLPPDVEIVSPQDFRPRQVYYQEPHSPAPPPPHQYGYANVPSPTVIRVASPAAYQRPRRDDQDLRRVASLHAAQRPVSPQAQTYSPVAPYRALSHSYGERQAPPAPRYSEHVTRAPTVQYMRSERSMSPPRVRVVRDAYAQSMQTPAAMLPPPPPPPPPPARKIVVDQYGNRYYANEPEAEPAPTPASRMSVAPQSRPELDSPYERAPSRATSVFYAPRPIQSVYEDDIQSRMPPPPVRRVTMQPEAETPDYRSYRQRDYSRASEPQHYREEPGPVYVSDPMQPPPPPPPPPMHRSSAYPPDPAASGAYIPRAYSVRPEVEPVRYVTRQPSMAPHVEYAQPPPIRAVSVMPGSDYGSRPTEVRYNHGQPAPQYPPPPISYMDEGAMRGSVAPQMRQVYVDQYGREVRQVPGYQ